jgi:hypothetical protein
MIRWSVGACHVAAEAGEEATSVAETISSAQIETWIPERGKSLRGTE